MPEHPLVHLQSTAGSGKETLKPSHPREPRSIATAGALFQVHPDNHQAINRDDISNENTEACGNKVAIPNDN